MLEKLIWTEKIVHEIGLPLEKYAALCIPPEEYLFDRFRLGDVGKEVFTPEAALILAITHPIIISSPRNSCVFGIRTLHIVSNIIPAEKIRVGVLPSDTPESDIEKLILADNWLTQVAFATRMPEVNIFKARKKMPCNLLRALSPALDLKVVELAKVLGITAPTLYNTRKSKKVQKPDVD